MSPIPIKVDFEYGWHAARVTLGSCKRSCKLVDIGIHFASFQPAQLELFPEDAMISINPAIGATRPGWPMPMSGVPRIIAELTDEKIFMDSADAQWIRQEVDALEKDQAGERLPSMPRVSAS